MKKRLFFSLFIISIFMLAACKGGFYTEENDNQSNLVNVIVGSSTARFVTPLDNIDGVLRYELEVYDSTNTLIQEFRKKEGRTDISFEEYKKLMIALEDYYFILYDDDFDGDGASDNEHVKYSSLSEEELDELLRPEYENEIANIEKEVYYIEPYFSVQLEPGKYNFVLKVFGLDDFNINTLLLSGSTKQEITDEENYVNIVVEEQTDIAISTGSIKYDLLIPEGVMSIYRARYAVFDDYVKNGNSANWTEVVEINTSKHSGDSGGKVLSLVVSDLPPQNYIVQYIFTFNSPYDDKVYISYVPTVFSVKKGFSTYKRMEMGYGFNINEQKRITYITNGGSIDYGVTTDESNNYYSFYYYNDFGEPLPIPSKEGYIFKGWSEQEESTVESKNIVYNYSLNVGDFVGGGTVLSVKELPEGADLNSFRLEPQVFSDYTLYAIWEEEGSGGTGEIVEPDYEPSYITNCIIIFPVEELIEDYRSLTIVLNYNDGSIKSISKSQLSLSGNSAIINNILLDVNIGNKLNVDFHITDKDGITTDIYGYCFQIIDGKIENQNFDLSSETINHNTGTGGEEQNGGYTITSSVQYLIDSNAYPEAGSVYSISTIDEFNQMALWTNGKGADSVYHNMNITYVLAQSIDASGKTINDVGVDSEYAFNGIFDGQGFEIKNISLSNKNGLFAYVGNTVDENYAEIKNLTVRGTLTNSKSNIQSGGIVGCAQGKVKITNCTSDVTVASTSAGDCGGICGKVIVDSNYTDVQICNCINLGEISGTTRIGGIVGNVYAKTSIVNCANLGKITFTSDLGGGLVGGVYCPAGYETALNLMQNCYNVGEVYSDLEDNIHYGSIIGGESAYNVAATATQLAQYVSYCYYSPFACAASVDCEVTEIEGITELDDITGLDDILNGNITYVDSNYSSLCKKWSKVNTYLVIIDGEYTSCPLF